MAIALPLIVHFVSPLQSAVEWLAGGPSPSTAVAATGGRPVDCAHPQIHAPSAAATGLPDATGEDASGVGLDVRTRDEADPTASGGAMGQASGTVPRGSPAATHPTGTRRRPAKSWGGPIRTAYADACARPGVRVVRDAQGNPSRVDAGRMVIAGRLADVCAELDRLVALETAH